MRRVKFLTVLSAVSILLTSCGGTGDINIDDFIRTQGTEEEPVEIIEAERYAEINEEAVEEFVFSFLREVFNPIKPFNYIIIERKYLDPTNKVFNREILLRDKIIKDIVAKAKVGEMEVKNQVFEPGEYTIEKMEDDSYVVNFDGLNVSFLTDYKGGKNVRTPKTFETRVIVKENDGILYVSDLFADDTTGIGLYKSIWYNEQFGTIPYFGFKDEYEKEHDVNLDKMTKDELDNHKIKIIEAYEKTYFED